MNREKDINMIEAIRRRLGKEIDSALWYEVNKSIDAAIEALKAQEDIQELADSINDAYAKGYNAAKREIALSGEYERAYQRGKADAQEWVPIKWHEITEEEREREGYPKDWAVHIDCDMPCDGDEILVQTKNGYIRWDVCYEDGELSLDSGWDWIEDIVAWMPLPEPYKEQNNVDVP